MDKEVYLSYLHGVGDCALFAPALKLWIDRGYRVKVQTPADDRQYFFKAVPGLEVDATGPGHISFLSQTCFFHHWYWPPSHDKLPGYGQDWLGNKLGHNLTQPPLPKIGPASVLWPEYLQHRFCLEEFLTADGKAAVDGFLSEVSGPLVVLHTRGNTGTNEKNFIDALELETYRALLSKTSATILLLDWDNRVARPVKPSPRLWHLLDWRKLNLPELAYLLNRASCLVGIDSGPLHVAEKWTTCPAVGVWFGHHPSWYSIPRPGVVHLLPDVPRFRRWTEARKETFNLKVGPISGKAIAEAVGRVLAF